MKIVFIPNLPYTYRDHERFGVKYFLEKGYEVEVLDVHNILIPGYKEKVQLDYWTFDLHVEVKDKEEALSKVKILQANDFIFFYTANKRGIQLLNEMKKITDAKFITYIGGSIPVTTVQCGLLNNLKLIINKYRKKEFFDTDFYVSGSKKDEVIFSNLMGKNTKLIKSNSRDYNLCLLTKEYQSKKDYCVFLDTDVINASDYELFNVNGTKNIENYLKKLIIFLKWIEENFSVDVIIAAHPKSRIFLNKNSLDGIKIEHFKSSSLVKNSKFVVNEGTTAVSYAVFFNKPILFFTLKEISFFYKHTCSFAKAFKKDIINVDILNGLTYKKISKELENSIEYENYKQDYLTYTDSKISTFDLIDDIFKSYNVESNGR